MHQKSEPVELLIFHCHQKLQNLITRTTKASGLINTR